MRFTCRIVGRGQHNKQICKFDKVLQQEKLDEWGNSSLKPPSSAPSRKCSSRKLKKLCTGDDAPHNLSNKDDNDLILPLQRWSLSSLETLVKFLMMRYVII